MAASGVPILAPNNRFVRFPEPSADFSAHVHLYERKLLIRRSGFWRATA